MASLAPALDLLYPPTCLLCGAPGAGDLDLCRGCADALPWLAGACHLCALPLPAPDASRCPACARRPPPWERLVAPLRYEGVVTLLVHRLKYRGRLDAARLLGRLLGRALASQGAAAPDLLVPVPLHPGRLRERGFNQSLELARPLARAWGLALRPAAVCRTRATPPQAGLGARERRANLRAAFAPVGPLDGERVALIDDVVTTGSTVEAVTRALLAGGAAAVQVWCCARTVR